MDIILSMNMIIQFLLKSQKCPHELAAAKISMMNLFPCRSKEEKIS